MQKKLSDKLKQIIVVLILKTPKKTTDANTLHVQLDIFRV
jgi:hypothetical protein